MMCTVNASLIFLAPPSAPCVGEWGWGAVYTAIMMYEKDFGHTEHPQERRSSHSPLPAHGDNTMQQALKNLRQVPV